jgi:hypothetical protein
LGNMGGKELQLFSFFPSFWNIMILHPYSRNVHSILSCLADIVVIGLAKNKNSQQCHPIGL